MSAHMTAGEHRHGRTIGKMSVILHTALLGLELASLVEVSSRIELIRIVPIKLWIVAHLPDIWNDDRASRDEMPLVDIVLSAAVRSARSRNVNNHTGAAN